MPRSKNSIRVVQLEKRCIREFFVTVAKSAKLLKSASEKRNPKKHLSPSVAICDRKHANPPNELIVGGVGRG